MNNIPDYENSAQSEVGDEYDQYVTVFGDPEEHTDKDPKKGGKGRLIKVIAGVLAVCILVAGSIAVYKLIPEKEEEVPDSGLSEISVLSLSSDDFKTVTVTNPNGTFKLYSETEESADDTSSGTKTVNWYLDGYAKELISTSAVSAVAGAAAKIDAIIDVTTKSAADCGLDAPVYKADVVTNDDAEFSVLIGDMSPDKLGVYLKLSTDDKIYIVSSDITETFDFDVFEFANTDSIPGIEVTSAMKDYTDEEGALSSFDSITVSGKNFPEEVVITPNTDESMSAYAAYITTAPTKRIASDKVDALFTLFKSGLSVTGVSSFDTSADTLSSLGLNDPDFVATIKIGAFTYTYKFKLLEDGSYAILTSDGVMIKKTAASNLSFINYSVSDFYANWVFLQAINDLSNFTVKSGDKVYSFDIVYDDSEDAEETYTITMGGKKITAQYFQNFYQYCISLSCADYTVDNLTAAPDMEITFTYTDTARGKSVVKFTKAGETKYQYSVDGIDMGKITSSAYNKILKYAEKVAEDKDIK